MNFRLPLDSLTHPACRTAQKARSGWNDGE